jgi:hypothetical protein
MIQPKLDQNTNTAEPQYSLKDLTDAWAAFLMGAVNV